MTCPACGKPATLQHLRDNPECAAVARSFVGIYWGSQRKTPAKAGPGRPPKAQSRPSKL
jgi:hypothetical protein